MTFNKVEDNSTDEIGIPDKCPTCSAVRDTFAHLQDEVVCRGCGLVVGKADTSTDPEWRAFSREERDRRERTGAPMSQSVHDKGLSTVIGNPRSGATQEQRELAQRIKKWQVRSRIHSSTDRNLIQAMSELSRLAELLNLPHSVKEKSAVIYRQALEADLVRGRSISAIVAASIYGACRVYELPRTLRDIANQSTVSKKDIARCYRLILKEIKLQVPVPDSTNKISGIASQIGIDENTQQIANKILTLAKRLRLTAGKDPMGLAAAALYIACQLDGVSKTQKAIASAAGVTEVTIRNRYKGLKEGLSGLDDVDERFSDFMKGKNNGSRSKNTNTSDGKKQSNNSS